MSVPLKKSFDYHVAKLRKKYFPTVCFTQLPSPLNKQEQQLKPHLTH